MSIEVLTDKPGLLWKMTEPQLVILVVVVVVRPMWGQIDVSNGNLDISWPG